MLRLIWLGEINDVGDIAAKAALGSLADRRTSVMAGRSLMAAADAGSRKQYAAYVKANCTALPATAVWDALEKLFPAFLGVGDLLDILSCVDVTATDGGLGLDWHGPKIIDRVHAASDVEAVLTDSSPSSAGESRLMTGN